MLHADSKYADYKLRIVGHSLGGGIAAILSLLLRKQFPDLRCLSFSPPGCTFSLPAGMAERFPITSYVLDDDIVPRLSLESMEHFRDEVLRTVDRIKVTKHQANNWKRFGLTKMDMLLFERDFSSISEFRRQLDAFRELKRSQAKKLADEGVPKIPLYPPGKIVHLSGLQQAKLSQRRQYAATWIKREDLSEIIISPHFLDDHRTGNVLMELERVANSFGLSSPFVVHLQLCWAHPLW